MTTTERFTALRQILVGFCTLLAYLILTGMLASTAAAQPTGLVVQVQGLRNSQGNVLVNVFRSEDGFPSQPAKAVATASARAATPTVRVPLNLPAGSYAIAVLHDEDGDGTTATNFLGIPKEGVGASNNAKGRIGPPKFSDARFAYAGGQMTITITIGY